MKTTLLQFTIKLAASVFMAIILLSTKLTAQQILQKSYAADEFNTTGNQITYSGGNKQTVTKMTDEGYLNVDFTEMVGAATDDFIKISFAAPLDLSKMVDKRIKIVYETDQSYAVWVALSNNPYGPYTSVQRHGGVYFFDTSFEKDSVDVKFANSDDKIQPYNDTLITTAYIILNPTWNPPTYTTGETVPAGNLKIHSFTIGTFTLVGNQTSEEMLKSKVFYNTENNTMMYANLPGNSNQILVYDVLGKLVEHKTLTSSSGEFSSNLSTGLYNVQLVGDNSKKSFKVLVQ